jgi:hypothetical protein
MKKLLLILLCLPMIGFGQSWERFISLSDSNTYSSCYGEQTQDGGYIITGSVSNSPTSLGSQNENLFLLKLDYQGDTLWSKMYPNINGTTVGGFVKQTFDSGYIVTANEEAYLDSMNYPLIIKTNSFGDTLWTRCFDWINYEDFAMYEIEQTADSGFIFRFNGHLIKTDTQCDTLWTKNYEGLGVTLGARTISQTTDGGYILIHNAVFTLFPLIQEAYLTKLNSQGDTLWNKIFNSDSILGVTSVEQTTDGGYIILGYLSNSINLPDIITCLTKTDSLGNIVWTKTYPYYDFAIGTSSQQTNDGGYIISMIHYLDTISYGKNILLLKTNNLGDTMWTNSIEVGGDSLVEVYYIEQTIDGGFFLVTMLEGGVTKEQGKGIIYLIKTDGNGNITSTFNIPTINTSKGELLKVTDLLGRETKGKKNEPLFYIYDDGTVEKRIVIE